MPTINVNVLEERAHSTYEEDGCGAVANYLATTLQDLGFTVNVRFDGYHTHVEVKGNQCISHIITPMEAGIDGDLAYDIEYFTNNFKLISLGYVETITAAIAIVCTNLTLKDKPVVING